MDPAKDTKVRPSPCPQPRDDVGRARQPQSPEEPGTQLHSFPQRGKEAEQEESSQKAEWQTDCERQHSTAEYGDDAPFQVESRGGEGKKAKATFKYKQVWLKHKVPHFKKRHKARKTSRHHITQDLNIKAEESGNYLVAITQ